VSGRIARTRTTTFPVVHARLSRESWLRHGEARLNLARSYECQSGCASPWARVPVIVLTTKVVPALGVTFGTSPTSRHVRLESRYPNLTDHKVCRWTCFAIGAVQHGHRGNLLMRAVISRRCTVAIEFGMCRSGRRGGASRSLSVG
jgi:hypothetical protein